jgi:hypothetical protein
MIALILASEELPGDQKDTNEDTDSEEEDSTKWQSKGRKSRE